ncbi:MAG: cupin domain-containing protein [Candidatus Bipolaricaulota bacterium]|nr:cupin domain-containing protein [Candidatus Bipolaricaulota bacterium]
MTVIGRSKEVYARDLHDGKTILHTKKRVLIGPEQGARNFVMRLFTLGEGGCSPYHTHNWEHEVFILSGKGTVKSTSGNTPVSAGNFVYVPPNEEHQFLNAGLDPFEFLCLVPTNGKG